MGPSLNRGSCWKLFGPAVRSNCIDAALDFGWGAVAVGARTLGGALGRKTGLLPEDLEEGSVVCRACGFNVAYDAGGGIGLVSTGAILTWTTGAFLLSGESIDFMI